jgi:hypothetical protein
MTTNELKNWMREQLEQGNSIAVVTAGQGGSGYALTNNEAIIADVDRFDDTEINIVDDEGEVEMLNKALVGDDELSNYDAVVKLANDDGEVLYILYYNDEKPEDIMLSKHGYNDDYLTWTYMGKEYWAEGEFYVDDSSVLHHTFIAPNGKEFEIVCDYE